MKPHLKKLLSIVPRWLPAILLMAFIFFLSSLPGWGEPREFSFRNYLSVRKVGHVVVFGFLALSYLRILEGRKNRYFLAWLCALLYAVTDEVHQSFVVNRNGSVIDVLVFDNIGAAVALFWHWLRKGRINMVSDSSLAKTREQAP
jgi:VanZ family protein